jgi:hypothetical protein
MDDRPHDPEPQDPGALNPVPIPGAPETPPAGRRGRLGRRTLVALVAGVAVVVGGGVALAFFMMRGSPERLADTVPSQADVFVTIYLDPSAGQKVNLLGLARQFPDLGKGQDLGGRVNDVLDEALAESGLTHDDVRPWLGSEIGLSVEVGDDGTPHAAFLVATTDPEASQAALEKLGDRAPRVHDYDGVQVSVSTDGVGAFAIVGDVVVLATDETTVRRAIDAAHGTTPDIGSSQIYMDTVAGLPQGKLGMAFVNVAGLVDRFGSETAASAAIGAGGLSGLDAIESVGISVSAETDGLALDMTTNYDSTKLSAAQREAFTAPDHENATLAFVPDDAFAVMAQENLDTILKDTLDQMEQQTPEAASAIDQAGIRGLLGAMTGDIALEIGPGTKPPVSGALIVGTDDPEQMGTFLKGVAGFASQLVAQQSMMATAEPEDLISQMEACTGTPKAITRCQKEILSEAGGSTYVPTPSEPRPLATEQYQGVEIAFIDDPALAQLGLAPAYAVVDGAGVIATSPEEIHQLIDTEASGQDIRTASVYSSATARVPTTESVFFLDVQAIATTVRQNLPAEAQAVYDREVRPNLAPISAFVIGSESDEQHQRTRMFLQIRGADR